MAEIGYGYGSEYQLLRFLGHHRNYLNKSIKEVLKSNNEIHWLDYPVDKEKKSLDGEMTDVTCFKNIENFNEIDSEWKKFWPVKGKMAQNWDGIFTIDNTYFFVEAKAHKSEAFQTTKSNNNKIKTAFSQTQKYLNSNETKNWIKSNSYQLANRLAFIYFCNEIIHVPSKLLYIGFLNDWENDDGVKSKEEWEKIWQKEYIKLGLEQKQLDGKLYNLYLDCKDENIFSL